MKANELRIGNLVNYKYWNPEPNNEQYLFEEVKIIGFLKNKFYFNFKGRNEIEKVDELHPIPLTEEQLVRLGGVKNTLTLSEKLSIEIMTDKYQIRVWDICVGSPSFSDEVVTIKKQLMVHELQNIVHALIGRELTIKEP